MLDEVDAPLDDANVGRFCDMVREMSERVQFVFITHNKTTMELANQLTGVTMHEPGVSRLVAVDVDEAVRAGGGADGSAALSMASALDTSRGRCGGHRVRAICSRAIS